MVDGIEALRVKLENAYDDYRFLENQYREIRQKYDLLLKDKESLQIELDKLRLGSSSSFTAEETSAQFKVLLESLNREALKTGYAIKNMDVEMDTRLISAEQKTVPVHELGNARIKFTFLRAVK